MICPNCRGRGIVRRRLIFFTWRHTCWKCGGTGQIGAARAGDFDDRFDRRDDFFRDRSDEQSSADNREAFDVGSGGRSGGGGGGASWDADTGSPAAAAERDSGHPVIVDPFAGDAVAAEATNDATAEAEAASGSSDAGSESGASADDGGSRSDGGTTY